MKELPFTLEQLESIAARWPTPFHIYDEASIVANARRLKAAFAWNKGFHEYFAVKAAPNPHLMALLRKEGFGSDCSSMAELVLAEAVGNVGEDIMFTSNDTPGVGRETPRPALLSLEPRSAEGRQRHYRKARGGEIRFHETAAV